MFRIDGPGATNDNKFTEGDPASGTRATVVTDEWLNSLQEELANAIENDGYELSKADQGQLRKVIAGRVVRLNDITELQSVGANNLVDRYQFSAIEYFPGSGFGGGIWIYDSSRPKSHHDGVIVVSGTVAWDGAKATLEDFHNGVGETDPDGFGVFVRQENGYLSLYDSGLINGDESFDQLPALKAILKASAAHRRTLIGDGTFRIDGSMILDSSYSGARIDGKIGIKLYGSFSANIAAFLVPQVGDNYGGGVSPANDLRMVDLEFDGTNATSTGFTSGLVVFGGENNKFGNVRSHGFEKSGVLLASITGTRTDVHVDHLESFENTNGSVGQGLAIASENDYDSITFGRAILHSNGSFGFDFSQGSVTGEFLEAYSNNTANGTGGGGKWAGGYDQKIRVKTVLLHDNTGSGAFSNTEAFTLLDIDHLEAVNNSSSGMQFPFGGTTKIGFAFFRENGSTGITHEAGDLTIGKLSADGNGTNGISSTGGNLSITRLETKNHTAGAGAILTTPGEVFVGSASSDNDNNGCIRLVPGIINDKHTIGPVKINHDGAPGSGFGVFLNANCLNARIGKITATGAAQEISDGGVNTERQIPSYRGSASVSIGTVTSGESDVRLVNVPGAVLGQQVEFISYDQNLNGLILTGYVSAGDTVSAVFYNPTGAGISIDDGSIRVRTRGFRD